MRTFKLVGTIVGAMGLTGGWLVACSDDALPTSHILDHDGAADGIAPDGDIEGGQDAGPDTDPGPSLCNPDGGWGTPAPVPGASTTASDHFGAITDDELTIAWMSKAGEVLYADRSSPSDTFGAPRKLTDPSIALERVALSGDGLTLIVVLTGNTSFAQITRSARGTDFTGTLDPSPFFMLPPPSPDEDASAPATLFADPVLSSDGTLLYYTQFGHGQTATLSESYRAGDVGFWKQGRVFTDSDLVAVGGKLRRPTGISSDDRTLYYWDETTSSEHAAYRKGLVPPQTTWSPFVELGPVFHGAQAAGKCGRLYFDEQADGSADTHMFYADKQ